MIREYYGHKGFRGEIETGSRRLLIIMIKIIEVYVVIFIEFRQSIENSASADKEFDN